MRGVNRKRTFDLRRYDPLDSHSRLRLQLAVLDEERCRARDYARDQLLYALAVSNWPKLTGEARQKIGEQARQTLDEIYHLEFPWLAVENPQAQTTQAQFDAMAAKWKEIWGDPNDPVIAERIQRTADALMRPVQQLQQRNLQLYRAGRRNEPGGQ